MTIIQFVCRLIKEQPVRFALIVASLVISAFLEGIGVALIVPMFQMIQSEQNPSSIGTMGKILAGVLAFFRLPLSLLSVLISVFVLVIISQTAFMLSQKLILGSMFLFISNLRMKLYEAIFYSRWSFFLKQKIGNLTNALTVEPIRACDAFSGLNNMIATIVISTIYIGLAFTLSWQMTIGAVIIGGLVLTLLRKMVGKARGVGTDLTESNAELGQEAIEQIAGAKLIKTSAGEHATVKRFRTRLESILRLTYISGLNQAWAKAIYDVAISGVLCIGIYLAVVFLHMSITTLIVFLFIFYRLSPRLSNLQSYRHQLLVNLPALDKIESFYQEATEMQETGGKHLFRGLSKGIFLKGVSFGYSPEDYVVKNLNIEIPRKKTVAIVGSSGAGKSTVIDLIVGLLTSNQGSILLDGTLIIEYDLKSWRQHIGYLAQDTILFHDTVKTNISWFYPEAKDEEIVEAAKTAYAHEFIEQLPQGYETIVGDRGVRLSGGQRQRIALARAIIRKPEILILDEATSALDAESENKIQKAIEMLAESITIIIVTHRLATVKIADYIYVLENGRLVEEGTWDELVERQGRFFKLKQLQELELVGKGQEP